jgi:hypothetical protein
VVDPAVEATTAVDTVEVEVEDTVATANKAEAADGDFDQSQLW